MTGPTGLRVLVVDDDADQRYLLRRLFGRAGIDDVHEAVDGDQGLEVARQVVPDLVVLDLAMPGRSGDAVLPDLRAAVPDAIVVVLSNLARSRWEPTVRELGAVGFVEKRTPGHRLVTELLTTAALLEGVRRLLAIDLDRSHGSPGEARRFVRRSLGKVALHEDLVDAVELLVSELVTNAVVHASSRPRVTLLVQADRVRVEVTDDDPALPARREPDADRPGGRGLLLLDRLASAWGAEPAEPGKVVWFEVDRPAVG